MCLFCISDTKGVLHMPFTSQNHLCGHLNKFFHLFPLQKEKEEKRAKIMKNTHKKGVYQRLGVTA